MLPRIENQVDATGVKRHEKGEAVMNSADSTPSPGRAALTPESPSSMRVGAPLPCRPVSTRHPATRERVQREAENLPEPQLAPFLEVLWDLEAEESRQTALRMRSLAPFYEGEDCAALGDHGEADVYVGVTLALRCSAGQALRRIQEAHIAVEHLPQTFALLSSGAMPTDWFRFLLKAVGPLCPLDRGRVDAAVTLWDLGIGQERFRREVRRLVQWLELRADEDPSPDPAASRSVTVRTDHAPGIVCLEVTGPAPEILSFAQHLDASARAVQDAQRRALAEGGALPWDVDGTAETTGRPLTLAALRYALLTGADLDTDGVDVPADRFRLNVTVPALTLLGVSDEPGLLDGRIPLPAPMARVLAGREKTWNRILTDPSTGAFLPLPASRYTPTRAMLEHLRLRQPTCAVPGCNRPVSQPSECDHIEEYCHDDPRAGGRTELENLHLLCREHHRLKTAGLLDPVRITAPVGSPGLTRWRVGPADTPIAHVLARDDVDMATPALVERLQSWWAQYEARQVLRRELTTAGERSERERSDSEWSDSDLLCGAASATGWLDPVRGHRPPVGEIGLRENLIGSQERAGGVLDRGASGPSRSSTSGIQHPGGADAKDPGSAFRYDDPPF